MDRNLEAIGRGCGLVGLGRVGRDDPAVEQRVFDQHSTRSGVVVVKRVGGFLAQLAGLDHDAVLDAHVRDALRAARGDAANADAEVGGVGKQALFAGLDRIGKAFAGERFPFENAETATVERERAGVGEPESAERTRGTKARVPEGDFFGVDVRLHDRDERGFVLADRDAIFQLVFEEVAEVEAACGCGQGVTGCVDGIRVQGSGALVWYAPAHSVRYASANATARSAARPVVPPAVSIRSQAGTRACAAIRSRTHLGVLRLDTVRGRCDGNGLGGGADFQAYVLIQLASAAERNVLQVHRLESEHGKYNPIVASR